MHNKDLNSLWFAFMCTTHIKIIVKKSVNLPNSKPAKMAYLTNLPIFVPVGIRMEQCMEILKQIYRAYLQHKDSSLYHKLLLAEKLQLRHIQENIARI